MNEEIARLLAEAGVSTRVAWRDVIVLQNFAPAPPPAICHEVSWWHRGFNFVVLDGRAPRYFCKCRAVGNVALERETRARAMLSRSRAGALSVPPARGATSERLAIQASPFLAGSNYGRIAPGQSREDFLDRARTILEGAAELADSARSGFLSAAGESASISFETAARDDLDFLEAHRLLEPELLEALAEGLREAGNAPARPQHGDLWWNNLLIADDRIWLIDFEAYGVFQVPLYDDLTLLSSLLGLRQAEPGAELEALLAPNAESHGCREILRARALADGLDASQLDGALAFHAITRACAVQRSGGARYAVPHLANLRFVARRMARGQRGLLADD